MFYVLSQHVQEEYAKHPFEVVKVPQSTKWMARHEEYKSCVTDSSSESVFRIDSTMPSQTTSRNANNDSYSCNNSQSNHISLNNDEKVCEWTFHSDYSISLCQECCSPYIVSARKLQDVKTTAHDIPQLQELDWNITSAENSGIEYDLLRQRDIPILFYDDFVLYQVNIATYFVSGIYLYSIENHFIYYVG